MEFNNVSSLCRMLYDDVTRMKAVGHDPRKTCVTHYDEYQCFV